MEIWKNLIYNDIKENNRFEISDCGNLRNSNNGHIYKVCKNKEGYYQVCVSLGSRKHKKVIKIHIAVANAFCHKECNNLIVNHKDGNKLNNNKENLEWVTYRENLMHAIETGLFDTGAKRVKQIDIETGTCLRIFDSIRQATREMGGNSNSIIPRAIKDTNKKAYGYKWELV